MMKSIKQFFKKIFDFYVFSNIHVALASFSLTKLTLLRIGISDNITPLFVFFSTLLSYNFIRFYRLNTIKSWYNNWVKENLNSLIAVSLFSLIALLFLIFQIRLKALFVLFPFSLFTFLYVFPIKKISLREKPGIKLLLIAISWAGITVFFPLVQNYMQLRFVDYLVFIQRFFLVFALTIPFDIRDLPYDNKEMRTIPQMFGVKTAKLLALFAITLFILLDFIINSTNQIKIIDFIIGLLTAYLVLNMDIKKSKYYTSFVLEGIPILWLILYCFMR